MDCTYKTNKFRLPLLVIQGVTPTHSSFIVGFAFILKETEEDYTWAMQQIKKLYRYCDIPNPKVLITDADLAFANAITIEYPDASHLWCLWHVNKNVKTHMSEYIIFEEEQKEFIEIWFKVLYSFSVEEYERNWGAMKEAYSDMPDLLTHLQDTWLDHKETIVKCYTNLVAHMGNTSTSRTEGGHAALKRRLEVSIGDLLTVVMKIETLIKD